MKTKYVYLACSGLYICLLGVSTSARAQVSLRSIGVGASYWTPSLDYWNKRSMLTLYNSGRGATFSGAVMPTAAIEIGLTKGLSANVRTGYWSQSVASDVSVGGINRSEKLSLSIIPVSLDLKYSFTLGTTGRSAKTDSLTTSAVTAEEPFLTPYFGVGLSRYFINNDFTRTVTGNTGSLSESSAGNTYGVQLFVGAEKKLVKKLFVALDVRYHLGNYNQVVKTEATTATVEEVSLNGLEAGLALRLKFQ